MKNIQGKTVLLTGASRGIGTYIARVLAKERAKIICVSRSQDRLEKIKLDIEANGGQAFYYLFDIRNINELSVLIEQINQLVGLIDILINNAAIIEVYKPFQEYSLKEVESILLTNLFAAIELTRLVLPSMLDRNTGHIVNIASLAGKKGAAYNSIYSASKAGMVMWTDAIRQELLFSNVGISVICPGYVSSVGMTVNTGLPAPKLAGISKPEYVANAVLKAIKQNKAEIIVNQDAFTSATTKFLLAIAQFFPRLVDNLYQLLGVNSLYQKS